MSEEPSKPSVTPEQLAAVNARLDAYEAGQADAAKRASNRATAEAWGAAGVRREALKPTMWRQDHPDMVAGNIDKAHREDPETAAVIGSTRSALQQLGEEGAQLDTYAQHFLALADGLEHMTGPNAALNVATYLHEVDRVSPKLMKKFDEVDRRMTKELTTLEGRAKSHEVMARQAITTPVPNHVAAEIRNYFRTLAPHARLEAMREAVQQGDRETLGALLEKGVPRYLMGIRGDDVKGFDFLINLAETTMAPEHVARRDAARKLHQRLTDARKRWQDGNARLRDLIELKRHPNASKRVLGHNHQ